MKFIEFIVYFCNDSITVHEKSAKHAAIKAMSFRIDKGLDAEVESILDEYGNNYIFSIATDKISNKVIQLKV